jgi:hypothetical protein
MRYHNILATIAVSILSAVSSAPFPTENESSSVPVPDDAYLDAYLSETRKNDESHNEQIDFTKKEDPEKPLFDDWGLDGLVESDYEQIDFTRILTARALSFSNFCDQPSLQQPDQSIPLSFDAYNLRCPNSISNPYLTLIHLSPRYLDDDFTRERQPRAKYSGDKSY